jgi:hypothetical protein
MTEPFHPLAEAFPRLKNPPGHLAETIFQVAGDFPQLAGRFPRLGETSGHLGETVFQLGDSFPHPGETIFQPGERVLQLKKTFGHQAKRPLQLLQQIGVQELVSEEQAPNGTTQRAEQTETKSSLQNHDSVTMILFPSAHSPLATCHSSPHYAL